MIITHKIIVDFARDLKADTITVAKGDSDSRRIVLLLFSDGEEMDLSDVTSARINASANESTEIVIEAMLDVENSTASFVLPADMTTTAGKRSYTLTLTTETAVLTSPEWYINVVSQLRDDTDAITAEDLAGFRETLARIEAMYEAASQREETLPNPYSLSLSIGNNTYTYDGSEAVSVAFVDGNEMSF